MKQRTVNAVIAGIIQAAFILALFSVDAVRSAFDGMPLQALLAIVTFAVVIGQHAARALDDRRDAGDAAS